MDKQYEYRENIIDYGDACLAIVSKYYGHRLSVIKLQEILKQEKNSSDVYELLKGAQVLGFNATVIEGSIEILKSPLPLPAIVQIIDDLATEKYMVLHYIKNGEITIESPEKKIYTYTITEFAKLWTGKIVFLRPSKDFNSIDEIEDMTEGVESIRRKHSQSIPAKLLRACVYLIATMRMMVD